MNTFTPPIEATVGFPEGDPLSIAPAILLGHIFSKHIKHKHGEGVTPYAFADNLEFITKDCNEIIPAIFSTRICQ